MEQQVRHSELRLCAGNHRLYLELRSNASARECPLLARVIPTWPFASRPIRVIHNAQKPLSIFHVLVRVGFARIMAVDGVELFAGRRVQRHPVAIAIGRVGRTGRDRRPRCRCGRLGRQQMQTTRSRTEPTAESTAGRLDHRHGRQSSERAWPPRRHRRQGSSGPDHRHYRP